MIAGESLKRRLRVSDAYRQESKQLNQRMDAGSDNSDEPIGST
jgi:hypothetical protein